MRTSELVAVLALLFGATSVSAHDAAIFQNNRWVLSGTISTSTEFADLSTASRSTLTVSGTSATSVAFAHIATITNSTATVGTSGHLGGLLSLATDGTTGRTTLYGGEGRVDGRSTDASATHQYVGQLGRANFVGASLAAPVIVAGVMATTTIYQGDGTTPLTSGIAAGFYAPPIVGGALKFGLYASDAIVSDRDPMGYTTGAGGTITQQTNKATAVTLNEASGEITTNNANLAAATIVSFVFNNSTVAATDQIACTHHSGGTLGAYTINCRATGAGTAEVNIRNNTAGGLTDAIVIKFSVIKGATS